MGCNCDQRRLSLQRAGTAVVNGQLRAAAKEITQSAQSFAQDIRSAQARREMLARLAKSRVR
jgi:hypothetical protein